MKQDNLLNKLYEECKLSITDTFKSNHFNIITRSGIEKIQYAKKIQVQFIPVAVTETFAAVKAIGLKGEQRIETFGSACKASVKGGNAYYLEMAEKRALSRVVLKLMGLYEFGFLGEDEDLVPDEPSTSGQQNMIESLLRTSLYDTDKREQVEKELSDYTDFQASECIEDLQNNQQDPITQGGNYSQTDIKEKL